MPVPVNVRSPESVSEVTVTAANESDPATVTAPPKYAAPALTYSEYGLVIVMFVPALGAPAMYKVAALV